MPRTYSFVSNICKSNKRDQEGVRDFSLNPGRAFQTSPNEAHEESKYTRLIGEELTTVCLLLYQPNSTTDFTIYGKEVRYPPPPGVKKSEIKQRILEASLPISTDDYQDLKREKTLQGDDYTKIVQVVIVGAVYIPVTNLGVQSASRKYSLEKGWYKC